MSMAASPEFYKPPAAAFSPPCSSPLPAPAEDRYDTTCRTPTGSGISYLKEPTTCPPAPRKPLCKKRLFLFNSDTEKPLISLRLDELERIFRPHPHADKRRRGAGAGAS
ncbi:cyclin-dependent protein kinase inhibitor EL2-like [Panicum virgatum]|uniref:Uncharacterized protein n=1 Tax=Panicum virgatum TaxID=38727 RepID=A0A8T0NAZ5_PANVG|nr:cyclin-dependent protein kinase inhibitor EL2-like [Panicum virgatum]KAG2544196.1 hypothetical protein PVAP13_9NG832500 [Panicum virgatum]